MTSLLSVVLALTAVVAAVEAKDLKKRGLEEELFGYAQQNHEFPLGGPLDLGILEGLELQSYATLLQHSGYGTTSFGHGLDLARGKLQFQHIPYSLSTFGHVQYGAPLTLSGVGSHHLTSSLLLANGGLPSGYAGGYGFGPSNYASAPVAPPVSSPGKTASTVTIPQPVAPVAAVPKPTPIAVSAPAPKAFPPATPSASFVPITGPAPQAPRANLAQTQAAVNPQPATGTLGSGSIGYTSLGNGLFALGSGSLGYTPPSGQVPQLNFKYTNTQAGARFSGLYGTPQLGYQSAPQLGYGASHSGAVQYGGGGQSSGYGGYSLNNLKQSGDQAGVNQGLFGVGSGYGGGAGLVGYGSLSSAFQGY